MFCEALATKPQLNLNKKSRRFNSTVSTTQSVKKEVHPRVHPRYRYAPGYTQKTPKGTPKGTPKVRPSKGLWRITKALAMTWANKNKNNTHAAECSGSGQQSRSIYVTLTLTVADARTEGGRGVTRGTCRLSRHRSRNDETLSPTSPQVVCRLLQ
jgi:hypothetical protein